MNSILSLYGIGLILVLVQLVAALPWLILASQEVKLVFQVFSFQRGPTQSFSLSKNLARSVAHSWFQGPTGKLELSRVFIVLGVILASHVKL